MTNRFYCYWTSAPRIEFRALSFRIAVAVAIAIVVSAVICYCRHRSCNCHCRCEDLSVILQIDYHH